MRLYPEQMGDSYQNPDGKRAPFGKNDWGVPGEQHVATPMVQARNATQLFAHFNPNYQPSHVDPNAGLGMVPGAWDEAFGMGAAFGPFARGAKPAQSPGMMPPTFLPPRSQRAAFTSAGEPRMNRLTRPAAGEFLISERPSVRERAVLRAGGLGELSPRLGSAWGVWGGLGDGFTVYPDGKTALANGYGQLYSEAGQVKITSPVGPFIVKDIQTIYPSAGDALKQPGAYGYVYAQSGTYYVSSPVGGIKIASPYVQGGGAVVTPPPAVPTVAPSQPAPTPTPAPSPTPSQMAAPPPSPAPSPAPAPASATPLPAPTPTPSQQASAGTATPSTPASSSSGVPINSPPPVNVSTGGAGSLASPSSGALTTEEPAPVAPAPVGFFSSTLTLPVVGTVPTWGVLAALGAFGFVMWKQKKGRR